MSDSKAIFGPYISIEGIRKFNDYLDYLYEEITGNVHHRTFSGGKLWAEGNAHGNKFNGGEGPDELGAGNNAHRNSFDGGEAGDRLRAWGNAHHNIFNGNEGSDELWAGGNTHHNIFNGNEGSDGLWAGDNTHHNSFNGGEGPDELRARNNAYRNSFSGDEGWDSLWARGNGHHNIFNGGEGNDELWAEDNTHHNTFNGGEEDDELLARGNAHHNTLNGGAGKDELWAWGDAHDNSFYGGKGEDQLYSEDNARHNSFDGGEGSDELKARDNAHHNSFNGGEGSDELWVKHNAHHNTLNGDEGSDELWAWDSAHHNVFNGGEGKDELWVRGNAYHNSFNGSEGEDVLFAYGNADNNTLNGGRDDDVIVSARGGILQGETGDDFILTYLPDGNLFSDINLLTMVGGEGHDVLIGSGLFWQAQEQEFEGTLLTFSPSWTLDASEGDDVIIPYLPLETLSINQEFQNSIDNPKQRITTAKIYKPVDEIRNTNYQITTGEGKDIVALSSKPAQNVTTQIKDFNWNEDSFAFDSADMAAAIVPELAWAKALSITKVDLNYKGHHYTLSKGNRQNQMPVEIKTAEVDGIEIQYPDFGENFELSYDYYLYDAKAVADKVSSVEDPRQLNRTLFDGVFTKKTFSKTYTIKLEKNNFVTTKTALNLTPNEKGVLQVKLGAHLSDTVVSFRARDLFAGENTHTCLYQNLATNEALYFKTPERQDMPENIAAVVVVQEKNQGLVFTTQFEKEKVDVSPTTQIFTASDFFRKGHFAMADGHNNDQQKSVTMRLGLVLKGKDNNLITTPLSDPIRIAIGK